MTPPRIVYPLLYLVMSRHAGTSTIVEQPQETDTILRCISGPGARSRLEATAKMLLGHMA